MKYDEFDGFFYDTDILNLYIKEATKYPLLTDEEEKKYGEDLLLRNKISIFTKKKYLTNKEIKTIDLEKIFISLDGSKNANDIIDLLMSYYSDKEQGINKVIKNYIILYKELCNKLGRTPNRDELKNFFDSEMRSGIFSKMDAKDKLSEKELLKQIRYFVKYSEAFDLFVNSNYRFVIKMAKHYHNLDKNNKMELIDLINEGNIGLLSAVERYDINTGCKFSTYANDWIMQGITRSMIDKGVVIRLPSGLHYAYYSYLRKLKELEKTYGRKLLKSEVSKELGISLEKVKEFEFIASSYFVASLDKPTNEDDDDCTMMDIIPNNDKGPEDLVIEDDIKDGLIVLLDSLSEKEKEIIKLRFGFYDNRVYTLEEVGKIIGVTRERIRQIEAKGLRKLRIRARKNNRTNNFDDYL